LALLSVVVIGVLHTASMDLRVVKNYGDKIQAHYLALAGIEKTKALLYQDAISRRRSAQNHSGELYDAPEQFRDVRLGRGQFRVFRQGRRDEGSSIIFGVIDEESRLNVNQASTNELGMLYGMTRMSLPQSSTGGTRITP
jgi:type II secretory pathway component PulK